MSIASVSLLLASLVVAMPASSQAGPVTREYINGSFEIAVTSLNRMRVFAKACGLSETAEPIAQRFMSIFSMQTGVSIGEVNKIVENAYASAPEATRPAQDCEMKYVRFWAEAFRQQSQELDEVLTRYLQQN